MSREDTAKPERQQQRLTHEGQGRSLAHELDEILLRVDRLRILDSRSPDEIVGYDQHGVPHE